MRTFGVRARIFPCFRLVAAMSFLASSWSFAQTTRPGAGVDFKAFVDSTFEWETIAEPAATAAGSQFIFKPAGFGPGAEGYGHHYAIAITDNVSGKFMRKFLFPVASGVPDNYVAKGNGNLFARFLNAATHTIFADPQTRKQFNWSGLPAGLASAALSDAYQPRQQQTWSATFQRFGTNTAGYFFGDVVMEFQSLGCGIPVLRNILKCK